MILQWQSENMVLGIVCPQCFLRIRKTFRKSKKRCWHRPNLFWQEILLLKIKLRHYWQLVYYFRLDNFLPKSLLKNAKILQKNCKNRIYLSKKVISGNKLEKWEKVFGTYSKQFKWIASGFKKIRIYPHY